MAKLTALYSEDIFVVSESLVHHSAILSLRIRILYTCFYCFLFPVLQEKVRSFSSDHVKAIMQRQIIVLLITCLAIISCSSEKQKKEINFYQIDISRSSGWHDFYSIHVDSTNQFILKKYNGGKTFKYFKGNLTDSIIEKILPLVDSINITKYDSVYEPNCIDCPIYKIVITSKTRELTTAVRGNHSLAHLDSLVQIFTAISELSNLELVDTTYDFESFNHFLPPVAPVQTSLTDSLKNKK
ncbi:MAG TPA: hypothetical protein VK202_07945 [Bacteroidia bacterium]|nr:hypothetical protein [Bacteroidia bacterium]